MDHSDHKHCTCPHGRCLNHSPDWEEPKRKAVPNPGFFGQLRYSSLRCCGKGMLRMKETFSMKCKKCGRDGGYEGNEHGLCDCCGRKNGSTGTIPHFSPHPLFITVRSFFGKK